MTQNKMNIRTAMLMLLVLTVSVISVSAESSWKHAWDDFFNYKINMFQGEYWKMADANAGDIYGWYNKTPVAKIGLWELLVCARDLQVDVEGEGKSGSSESSTVYITTITMSVLKSKFNSTEFLYETSWYIQPLDYDSKYRVYLKNKNNEKYYVSGNEQWHDASMLSGDSGYVPFYSQAEYVKGVLEYTAGDVNKTFEVKVVAKKEE